MEEPTDENDMDCEDIVGNKKLGLGCALEQFKDYEEIKNLIADLKINYTGVPFEKLLDRYKYLIRLYQDVPHLMDPKLQSMLDMLLVSIRDAKSETEIELQHGAFKLITYLSTVRGAKVVVRHMPHEVGDLQLVLKLIDAQDPDDLNTWESRYVLLMWLSILVMIPFHMDRLDTESSGTSTLNKIVNIIQLYLCKKDSVTNAAVMLAGKFFTRPDAKVTHLPLFIVWALEYLSVENNSNVDKESILKALAQLFKHGKRIDMEQFGEKVFKCIIKLNTLENNDIIIRKNTIKLIQRIGLTYLRAKIASWRYNRGNRSLATNLSLPPVTKSSTPPYKDGLSEEEYEVPDEIEEIFEFLLKGLCDESTDNRWCAAKGVGRVCGRLPKELAEDVIGSVIDLFSNREGDRAWHGACLALAELGRRGLLLPQHLDSVIPLVVKALIYDEVKGNFSVGSHVRDAACYVCWAFARAYDSEVFKPYVQKIAEGLLITAVFDREITCRKAAAASFQENVGRQGTFPHGIEILTTVDFFTVALRSHAYLELSIYIAQFPEYTRPLISHLVDIKVCHWDTNVRILCSQTLHKLTSFDINFVSSQELPKLLKMATGSDMFSRHGAILAISEIVEALAENKGVSNLCKVIEKDTLDCIQNIAFILNERKLFKGLGGDLMRFSICTFIEKLSKSSVLHKEDWKTIDLWKDILCECLNNVDKKLQIAAAASLSQLCNNYIILDKERCTALVDKCLEGLDSYLEPPVSGYSAALGSLLIEMFADRLNFVQQKLLDCSKIRKEEQRQWVHARSMAIRSLVEIVKKLNTQVVSTETVQTLFKCFIEAMGDYTTNSRGDIGNFVRISAINALKEMTLILVQSNRTSLLTSDLVTEMFCVVLKVSVEKMDKVSGAAGKFLAELLYSVPEVPHIPHRDVLLQLFPVSVCQKIIWSHSSETFPLYVQLLLQPTYTYHLLLGFTISIGCNIEYMVRCTRSCLLTHLTSIKSDVEKLTHIENSFLTLLKDHINDKRASIPMLNMADFLLSTGLLDDTDPKKFPLEVLNITWVAMKNQRNIPKLVAMVDVLCDLINFEGSCRARSMSSLSIWLCHQYPRIRMATAQKLYEALVASADVVPEENMDDLLSLLSETNWSTDDRESLIPIRNKVCFYLGIRVPAIQSKSSGN